jgi:hypothetical protein
LWGHGAVSRFHLGKLAENLIKKQNERNIASSMENIQHMLEV